MNRRDEVILLLVQLANFDIVCMYGVNMTRLTRFRRLFGALRVSCLFLGLVGGAEPALGQMSQGCPSGNLIAGKLPYQWSDIRGDVALVTDGTVAKEGAQWDAPGLAVVLDSPAATLTYDLGSLTQVQVVYLQSDANDTLHIWASDDGREFRVVGQVDPLENVHGLRLRTVNLGGARMRFLRIGEGVGDNLYSLAELQIFCALPEPFPPRLQVREAPKQEGATRTWDDVSSRWWEMTFALLVCGLLYWDQRLKEAGRPKRHRRLRRNLLFLALPIAAMTYVNFFSFHFPTFIHRWDTFHYYMGAKYFREIGFERMYECVAVADYESPDPALRRRVELRKITDLRTNALVTTEDILKHPERCKKHFSAERWESWKKDLDYWRKTESPKRWDDTSTDHGYNATPVWGILGTFLSNLSPASDTQIYLLNALDPAYYVAMILLVWWAFGWRVTAVALTVFATFFPNRFYWTGGAFLRWDWLFYTTAVVCFLRKDKPILAGLALGYATLLRVFPGFLAFGPLVAFGVHIVRDRGLLPLTDLKRTYLRLFVGAAIAVAVLFPVSLMTSDGLKTYQDFVKNSIKHKETPLTNYMGLRTVVAYRPSEVGRKMKDNREVDPWAKWKQARLDAYKQARPLFYAIVLLWLVMLGYAGLRNEPWVMASLGITFIPITTELTCYYYAFVIGVAVLYEKRADVGLLLLILTAASEFISLAPLAQWNLMSTWIDEQYTFISALTIVFFWMILWRFSPDAQAAWERLRVKLFGVPDDEDEEDDDNDKSKTAVDPKAKRDDDHANGHAKDDGQAVTAPGSPRRSRHHKKRRK